MAFQGLKGGQKVRFWIPNGLGIDKRGFAAQEWKLVTGTVQSLLTFEDHVVAVVGGRASHPYVVDSGNFEEALPVAV